MGAQLIGRDAEVAAIWGFLSANSGSPAALVITGDAGIGKTTVWKHVIQSARGSSAVLSCEPSSAERLLTFSALDDLFGDVAGEILPALPRPRRWAIEAALLRDTALDAPQADPPDPGRPMGPARPVPERRVLARGILDTLRILSGKTPVVLAVDDAQWLDRPSADVLKYCLRRLEREPVSVVMTFAADNRVFPLGLDRALPPDRLEMMQLGPLSLGAVGEILRSRLDAALPRHTLMRLYEACGGNPFYALECARPLLERPRTSLTNEPIPIPPNLTDLVRHRLRRLTREARLVGRLAAASPHPHERVIRAAYDHEESLAAIDQAIDQGILERDGDVLRFTHPLLRPVLYAGMTLRQRREMHQRLGASAEDAEERAWHLALGVGLPGDEIAGMLDSAADQAASRGAPEEAAALAEQAMRLTPAGSSLAARRRMLRAIDYHFRAGSMTRSRELIAPALAACPVGPLRAALLLRLATVQYHQSGWPIAERTFHQAAEEAPADPALRARAEQELAFARLVAGDLGDASRWAHASLRSAEQAADPLLIAHSLARIALFEFLLGGGIRLDLLDRAQELEASAEEELIVGPPMLGPSLVRGVILKWCDRLDEARLHLAAQYRRALLRGDEALLPFLLYHFSQLECWAGDWDAAEKLALEGRRAAEESHQQPMRPATLYSLALVRAHRGQAQDAERLAREALSLCDRTGNVPLKSQVVALLGFIALSLGDHKGALSHLAGLADMVEVTGLGEPSVVKFLPDEIEALAALGEVERAWSLTRQLEARGRALDRPWALAAGARCRAHLAGIAGDLDEARAACKEALREHERLSMPFELGRTLLIKGMIEWRARQRSAARDSLGQAAEIFERLGASLWAGKSRRELSKFPTQVSVTDGLTETERRIAALVVQGLTNRMIAAAMFVTENTVQTHVRHIFRKLGVRSRTQLAAQLLSAAGSTAPRGGGADGPAGLSVPPRA